MAKASSPQETSQLREDSCDATETAGDQTESETTRRICHGNRATNSTRGKYLFLQAPSYIFIRRPTQTKLFGIYIAEGGFIYLEYPKIVDLE